MDNLIIPLMVISKLQPSQRAAVAEQLLPVALPGPSSQRLAVAAITAEQQVKRQTLVERNMVEEAVNAAHIPNAEALASSCPELHRAFTRLPPDLQTQIFSSNAGKSGPTKATPAKPRLAHPSKS